MTNIANLPAIADFPSSVAASFCKQLVSFQKIIDARGEDLCAPTPQEINMQSRMVSNVIRVNKHNATDHADKALRKFFNYLRKDDKELSKIFTEKYNQFMGIADETVPEQELQTPTPAPHPHPQAVAGSTPAPVPDPDHVSTIAQPATLIPSRATKPRSTSRILHATLAS